MSEERESYGLLYSDSKHDTVEQHARAGFVRVLDPATGRFLFEFDAARDLIIWRERGRRIEVHLVQYR